MPVPRRTDVSLVAQLEERSGLYDGLGTVDAERLRSALLARCFEGERTSELLPFCLEQIDAGHDPVAVATAARVLIDLPTALPSDLPARLWRAIIRLRARDRQIAETPLFGGKPTTLLRQLATALEFATRQPSTDIVALGEVLRAARGEDSAALPSDVRRILARLKPTAASTGSSCCCETGDEEAATTPLPRPLNVPPWRLQLEDQDGRHLRFGDYFRRTRSVVAFFYTRCDSAEKCSLTIANMAKLQRLVEANPDFADVRLAAFTYDPAFDTAARLRSYALDRGWVFGERARVLRTLRSIGPLISYFDLGVAYGPTTVNMHRIEVSVLGPQGRLLGRIARRRWDPQDVVRLLEYGGMGCEPRRGEMGSN